MYKVLGAGCRVLGAGCWVLGAGCWVLGAGCWVLGAGCWVLDAGCRIQGDWYLGDLTNTFVPLRRYAIVFFFRECCTVYFPEFFN